MNVAWLVLSGFLFGTACEDDAPSGSSDKASADEKGEPGSAGPTEAESAAQELELEEGVYYKIRSTGAIEAEVTGTGWGDQKGVTQARGLWQESGYRMLIFKGGNQPGKEAISKLAFLLLDGIEPGTYEIGTGANLAYTKAGLSEEEPVKILNAEVRFPDYEILSKEDEVDGSLTLDEVSEKGMSGSAELTLTGEKDQTATVAVAFDVPVTER
jgi:hypothetical protein